MNICLLSREYPPETAWGGIATYTHSLAHGLARIGHNVHVVSCTTGASREYRDGEVNVYRLHSAGTGYNERFFPYGMLFHSYNASRMVSRIHARQPLDIVEAPDWYAESFLYGLRRRVPLVVKFHAPRFLINRYVMTRTDRRTRFICSLEKRAGLWADSIITPSASLARVVAEKYGIERETIKVIPNFVSIPDREVPARRGMGRYVLFVGRLERVKGVLVLGEAISKVLEALPNVRFIFCGRDTNSAPDNGSMREYITRLSGNNPHVIFLGHCAREELFTYYRSAAVCCIPSLWETLPYVGLEAMSFGCPLVGSRVGGMTDIIDEGKTGLLFEPGNAVELARALIRLLSHPREAEDMGRLGRVKLDRQFSFEAVIGQQLDHYIGVIGSFGLKYKRGRSEKGQTSTLLTSK